MNYSVCLLAAGKGSRTKLEYNKVFYRFSNHPDHKNHSILDRSLFAFLEDADCKEVIITCASDEKEYIGSLYSQYEQVHVVEGGSSRQDSVACALEHVHYPKVFIHDAARPYLKREQIEDLKKTLETEKACLLMIPSVDTVKIVEDGYVKETLDRSMIYRAQTPQCFDTELIKECHKRAKADHVILTDDAHVVEMYSSVPIKVVHGVPSNKKVTLPSDLK